MSDRAEDEYQAVAPPVRELARRADQTRRWTQRTWGIIAAVGGFGFVGYVLIHSLQRGIIPRNVLDLGATALAVFIGIAGVSSARRGFQPDALLEAMRRTANRIVWIYLREVVGNGRRRTSARLAFSDGTIVEIPVPLPDAERLLPALAPFYPAATFGYSEENEVAFRRQPSSLIRGSAGDASAMRR